MKVEERVVIDARPEEVWALLDDLEKVVACVPGAELDRMEDGVFHGTMLVRLGPTRIRFRGRAQLVEVVSDERRGALTAVGGEEKGGTRAEVRVDFMASPTGSPPGSPGAGPRTSLDLSLDARFHGPLAMVVQTGGVRVVQNLILEFGERVAAAVGAPAVPVPAGPVPAGGAVPPAPAPTAPAATVGPAPTGRAGAAAGGRVARVVAAARRWWRLLRERRA